ncbi:MAG TPA: hypothetical protein ENO22_05720 [candidate division Zixibacteria bacterium]|nr:hypothetical protein [candidate division Zixibacteria bacterium]
MKPKTGTHRMRLKGAWTVVRPGDQIECEPYEIGRGLMFKFERLDPEPPPPEPDYKLKAWRREDDLYDVVNQGSGQKINDQPLSKAEAEDLTGEKIEDPFAETPPPENEPEPVTETEVEPEPEAEPEKEPATNDKSKSSKKKGGKKRG